jgi:hypothetical protein
VSLLLLSLTVWSRTWKLMRFICMDARSAEESLAGRRLVKFYRRQTAAKIEVHFHPHSPESYDPGSVVVSCIWNPKLKVPVVTYSDIVRPAH